MPQPVAIRVACVACVLVAGGACAEDVGAPLLRFPEDVAATQRLPQGDGSAPTEFAVPPPPFSEGIFPCQSCHAKLRPESTPRALEAHSAIRLEHGPRPGWCFDCHDPVDRDVLRLTSGESVTFDKSYRLCGQCHGDRFRDWRLGIHGRRTGSWNGAKTYLLCAHCHNPHAPRFKPIEPLPPPARPAPAIARKS